MASSRICLSAASSVSRKRVNPQRPFLDGAVSPSSKGQGLFDPDSFVVIHRDDHPAR